MRRNEQPKGQGGECIAFEVGGKKAERLAEWLNYADANGGELTALNGYGGGGSVYRMAVARRKQRLAHRPNADGQRRGARR